jgi:hypothetical protein
MSSQAVINLTWCWFRHVGFDDCASYSGRRTFIVNAAGKISLVGGPLRDVQLLAGRSKPSNEGGITFWRTARLLPFHS